MIGARRAYAFVRALDVARVSRSLLPTRQATDSGGAIGMGRVLADQDKHEEAINCFEEAISMLSISSRESLCRSPDTQVCTLYFVLRVVSLCWCILLCVRVCALLRFSFHTLHPATASMR